MSIIELETPWCFNTEELTEGEVIELGKHFVKEGVNYKYPWSNADSAQIYVGINSNNGSDYNCSIKEFDEDDNIEESVTVYTIEQLRTIIAEHLGKQPVEKLEDGVVYYVEHDYDDDCKWLVKIGTDIFVDVADKHYFPGEFEHDTTWTYTKATPAQIAHYEACIKAGKYVEPESVTEFVVGKWYKYDESSYFKYEKIEALGSYKRIYHSDEICDKSYNNTPDYIASNDYEKYALEHPLEDLSEIQELLPEGHPDKVVKSKSERYLATMKFFEQLREPERSEAITNYDEDATNSIPGDLSDAVRWAFCWSDAEQGQTYWSNIEYSIRKNTYFKEEPIKEEPKVTEIKPAKGMYVRCLKQNTWGDGKTEVGQVLEIENVSSYGDLWVKNQSLAIQRIQRGEFELLPDHKEEPWVAQVGDWVYVLNSGSSCLLVGDIVKCDHHSSGGNAHFETFRRTNNSPNSYLSYENYRKATQEEIDFVTKTTVTNTPETDWESCKKHGTIWTADNWYVEVTSQAKAEAAMATGYVNYMQELTPKGAEYLDKLHQQTQQDELVIYKPKQTRLVEPGAVSASVSTTNLIIKSNSKYL